MSFDIAKLKMGAAGVESWFQNELQSLRTGRASPALLDGVQVEVYGSRMRLVEVATISVEDARSIYVSPWDKGQIKPIEKAITVADLGVGVGSDAVGVRVSFPELTTERRQQLIKLVKSKLEEARVSLKGERQKAIESMTDDMSDDQKANAKVDIQKVIDDCHSRLEVVAAKKEQELLT